MTTPSGILSVRVRCEGGDVANDISEIPDGWFNGASHFVIMVHGFNNDTNEAREYYSQLTSKLPNRFPKVGWFFWPGDANLGWFDILDFISYPTEIKDAKDSARHLANRLIKLAQENPGVQVTLVGHSLGCRLISECIHILAKQPPNDRPIIQALLFLAAAVPVELVETGEPLGQSLRDLAFNGIMFYSNDDLVLQFAFPAGQTLAAAMGNETAIYFEPIGRNGNPHDLFTHLPENRSGNRHGDYWADNRVFSRLCEIGQAAISRRTEERNTLPPRIILERQLPVCSAPDCKYI